MMTKLRVWLVVGSAAAMGVLGCGDPGVSQVAPVMAGAAATGTAGTSPVTAGTVGATVPPAGGGGAVAAPAGAGGSVAVAGTSGAAGVAGSAGAAGSTAGAGSSSQGGAGGSGGSAGSAGAAGAAGSAGAGGSAGTGTPEMLPPCPMGWKCVDPFKQLSDMGADGMVTDAAGKPVATACGIDGLVDCNPADPVASCEKSAGDLRVAKLSKPFCAHIVTTGLLPVDLYSCAQLCKP